MPPSSRTSADPQGAPESNGPQPPTSRLHVFVTPTGDVRALLSSLAALAVSREPRLEVTAVCPPGGLQSWTFDRRFRILDEAANANDQIAQLNLGPADMLVFLRAGCLVPRGWVASLLVRSQATAARGIAALAWAPRPSAPPETELLGWEAEAHNAQLHHCHHCEDRAEVETPLLAITRPDLVVEALTEFWAAGCTTSLNLRNAAESAPRLIVAKDLLVWQDELTPPLLATVAGEFGESKTYMPRTVEEAAALEVRLLAVLERVNQPELHIRLAEIAISRGDRKAATRHARACLETWPDHAAAQLIIARALISEDRLVAARKIIETLLSMGPLAPRDRASAFACLASIWLRQGDPAQARPCLEVALAIDSDHPIARYGMARLALAAGRFTEALEHLEHCLASAPLSPDIHFELGRARVLAGQLEPGMQALALALRLRPDHIDAAALLERLSGH